MRLPMNAYQQGQMARFDKQPRSNPYSMFSNFVNYEDWNNGYDKGGWDPQGAMPRKRTLTRT